MWRVWNTDILLFTKWMDLWWLRQQNFLTYLRSLAWPKGVELRNCLKLSCAVQLVHTNWTSPLQLEAIPLVGVHDCNILNASQLDLNSYMLIMRSHVLSTNNATHTWTWLPFDVVWKNDNMSWQMLLSFLWINVLPKPSSSFSYCWCCSVAQLYLILLQTHGPTHPSGAA